MSTPEQQPAIKQTAPAGRSAPDSLSTTNQPVPLDNETAQRLAAQLEQVYTHIYQQRMQDIPVINDKIKVQAIGLCQWHDTRLCIMITPWFMNIMLLPSSPNCWDELQETSSVYHNFPSGRYEFLVGYEPALGKYQMCSLFSPMFEFADHQAAIDTAEAALQALMDEENIEVVDIEQRDIKRIWSGEIPAPQHANNPETTTDTEAPVAPKEKTEQKLSRRQFLRGAGILDKDKPE